MTYLSKININSERQHPFPFDVPAIKYAKNINLSNPITFIIGENGTGKSTLLETLACRLQLPHMDGSSYRKASFDAAKKVIPFLELEWSIERSVGFFFRAEDFGDYLNSIHRSGVNIETQMGDLGDGIPQHIKDQMRDSANYQLHHVRRDFGQDLNAFSHGEAYLHIMEQKINSRGIYLLDEPEAALSPARQLSFMYFIQNHLKQFNSQFIIATHSPMLMAYPNANLYEVTNENMVKTEFADTDHYMITKSFLDNPNTFLRHFD